MYKNILFLTIIFVFSFLQSCNNEKTEKNITLYIQPFNDCPKQKKDILKKELGRIYTNIVVNSSINLPDFALNATKTRHRADKLIKFLSENTSENSVSLGVTAKDISVTKGKYADWGVMGLAYKPGKSCVISSFRLKGKNQDEKLYKVAIHELGHTQGLNHCPDKSCYMRDAEGKDHLNEEIHFCEKCKTHLIEQGWKLK